MSDGENNSARQIRQNIGEKHEGSYTVIIDEGSDIPEDNLANVAVLH